MLLLWRYCITATVLSGPGSSLYFPFLLSLAVPPTQSLALGDVIDDAAIVPLSRDGIAQKQWGFAASQNSIAIRFSRSGPSSESACGNALWPWPCPNTYTQRLSPGHNQPKFFTGSHQRKKKILHQFSQ